MLGQRAILPPATSVLPATADHVVVSVSPKAGSAAARPQIDRLVALLHQAGLIAEVLTDLDQVAIQANAWHAQGRLRALVGVGGTAQPPNWSIEPCRGCPSPCCRRATRTSWPGNSTLAPRPSAVRKPLPRGGLSESMPAAPPAGYFCSWWDADWMAESFAACMAAGRDRSAAPVMSNQFSIRCVITDIPNFGYIGTTISLGLPGPSRRRFSLVGSWQ